MAFLMEIVHIYTEGMVGHSYSDGKGGHGYSNIKGDMSILMERGAWLY